uniref:Uncharacterized protein n=1 Tax=Panagrellus redivivus TaxID=6233 RepID=A0A7E4VJ09_PANRE
MRFRHVLPMVGVLLVANSCLASIPVTEEEIKSEIVYDSSKKVTNITLDQRGTGQLFGKWNDQALSGLMAAVASAKLRSVPESVKKEHEACAKEASTIVKHAKCVSKLLKTDVTGPSIVDVDSKTLSEKLKPKKIHVPIDDSPEHEHQPQPKPSRLTRFGNAKKIKFNDPKRALLTKPKLSGIQKIGAFEVMSRKKRNAVRNSDSYILPGSQLKTSPFGTIARNLLKDVLHLKNKTASTPWQTQIVHAQEAAKMKKEMKMKARQRAQADPYEGMAFKGVDQKYMIEDMMDAMEEGTPEERRKVLDKLKTVRKDPTGRMLGLLRDVMKLGATIAGRNASEYDEKQLNIMSPRFLSVTEEDPETQVDDVNMLSPSILSLHDRGRGLEKTLSLPNLMKGFTGADQQAWLDLIFEASGVDENIQKAKDALTAQEFQISRKKRYEEKMVDEKGEPLYFTKETAREKFGDDVVKRIDLQEKVSKLYTKAQQRDINETGFTMMTPEQLHIAYGSDSPHNNSAMIKLYENRTKESLHDQLIQEIHALALMDEHPRHKRAVLAPTAFATILFNSAAASDPLILSPLIFSTIVGSPIWYGPAILSPWWFIPLILSPRTLSPAILNPFGFVCVILSPLTLHPIILSPGIFNPFVLSPLLMTPLILSPQVFTPLILCPLVMSPFILNPGVGTPLVLSPFVLNPVILSPLTLFALVLSPNALSPVIMSKLFLAEIILSPSWLS